MEFVSSAGTGFYEPTSGFWFIGDLDTGVRDSLVIAARVGTGHEGALVTNGAAFFSADQPDVNPLNNLADVPLTVRSTVDFTVDVTSDLTNGSVGDPIEFAVLLSNEASIDANNVRVHVELPAAVSIDAVSPAAGTFDPGTGFWDIPLVGAGTDLSLGLDCTILPTAEGSVMTFSSHIESAEEEIIGTDDDADSLMVSVGFVPDVAVSKSADRSSALEGDTVVYTIRVENTGGMELTGIALADPPPPQVSYVGHTVSQGAFDPVSGIWVVGSQSVAETDSVVVTMVVNPGADGSTITNTVSLTSVNEGDAVPDNDVASVDVLVDETVDLEVAKSASVPAATVGQVVTFQIAVANVGSVDATGVVVTDLLPAGLQFVAASFTSGGYSELSGEWDLSTIGVGVSDTLWIEASPMAGHEGTTIVNTAAVTAVDQADRDTSNDSDSAPLEVLETLDLGVTIAASDPTPRGW